MQINGISITLQASGGGSQSTVPAKASAAANTASAPAAAALPTQSPATTAVAAASSASAAASLIAATYSVTAAGRSYSGSVSQSNGLYQISVANLPGASVTAASLQEAEIALTVKIDTLV
jgi:hypothetical protein